MSEGSQRDDRLILLTGATGYVGGRLLAALESAGHRLRCLARRPEHQKLVQELADRLHAGWKAARPM